MKSTAGNYRSALVSILLPFVIAAIFLLFVYFFMQSISSVREFERLWPDRLAGKTTFWFVLESVFYVAKQPITNCGICAAGLVVLCRLYSALGKTAGSPTCGDGGVAPKSVTRGTEVVPTTSVIAERPTPPEQP